MKIHQNRAELWEAKAIRISINFRAFAPIQNGGRKREVAYI